MSNLGRETPPPAPPLRERGADRKQTFPNVRLPSPGGEGPGVGLRARNQAAA